MAYTQSDFIADVVRGARAKHLDYERSRFLLARWWAEFSGVIPNDGTIVAEGLTGAEVNSLMVRCAEVVADYEANANAKRNTILAVSDLPLGE